MPDAGRRSNWVRLRTLIVLRWIAIAGQLAAITVSLRYFDLELNIGLCFLAIGAAITANLVAVFIYPENKRLSEEVRKLKDDGIETFALPVLPEEQN